MNPLDRPWLLHPAVVHFPIALLLTGFAVTVIDQIRPSDFRKTASRRLLWAGTLAAWAAMGLGLLAEDTVPHVPAAWHMLSEHETSAYWTVGFFTVLSVARLLLDRKKRSRTLELVFLAGWLMAAATVVRTAWLGGELVYSYNVGTKASAE